MISGEKSPVSTLKRFTRSSATRQRQVHLSDERQAELVARFEAGATQRELSDAYGVHRATVASILARHGITPQRGLNREQVDEAVARYKEGQSLATIGSALGVDPGTVRARLLERGVVMRSTAGARRRVGGAS